MLYSDMMKMANDCNVYKEKGTKYYDCSVGLEKYLVSEASSQLGGLQN